MGHDVLVPDDKRSGDPDKSGYLCTCLMYFHPTKASKTLAKLWADRCKGQSKNQFAFNSALGQMKGKIDRAVLRRDQFPPGALASRYIKTAAVVHANYHIGTGTKESFL